jgi:glycine cleavage system H lipoate-binding protein
VPEAGSVASFTYDFDGDTPLDSVDEEIFATNEEQIITVDTSKISQQEYEKVLFIRLKNEDTGHKWVKKLIFTGEASKCTAE